MFLLLVRGNIADVDAFQGGTRFQQTRHHSQGKRAILAVIVAATEDNAEWVFSPLLLYMFLSTGCLRWIKYVDFFVKALFQIFVLQSRKPFQCVPGDVMAAKQYPAAARVRIGGEHVSGPAKLVPRKFRCPWFSIGLAKDWIKSMTSTDQRNL